MNMLRVWGGGIYENDLSTTFVTNTAFWFGKTSCSLAAHIR